MPVLHKRNKQTKIEVTVLKNIFVLFVTGERKKSKTSQTSENFLVGHL
jgi:hypothetical protein